eukprot:CAMPEP_0183438718 /NCGR_PEP_ID=MMETSP0370-20130417/77556_1 /TAXON_ID=268820 /ORGANISM="Peridinium aciculiferum, Strain PAER-2" /LENGTH=82 /DNA_ID=CAMNT_0025627003 /DNA_START=673 /DNA_END=921 /DNA_ORIENTATION=+
MGVQPGLLQGQIPDFLRTDTQASVELLRAPMAQAMALPLLHGLLCVHGQQLGLLFLKQQRRREALEGKGRVREEEECGQDRA